MLLKELSFIKVPLIFPEYSDRDTPAADKIACCLNHRQVYYDPEELAKQRRRDHEQEKAIQGSSDEYRLPLFQRDCHALCGQDYFP